MFPRLAHDWHKTTHLQGFWGGVRCRKPEVAGSSPARSITNNAARHAGSRLEDGTPLGAPDAISTPEWSDLASRRARIASSESRARCPDVAHLAQVGVAHEGVDVTTGKRPKNTDGRATVPTRRSCPRSRPTSPRHGRKSQARRLQHGERSGRRCARSRGTRDNCPERRVGWPRSRCQGAGTRVVPDASLADNLTHAGHREFVTDARGYGGLEGGT
jgi:hypothetical protein